MDTFYNTETVCAPSCKECLCYLLDMGFINILVIKGLLNDLYHSCLTMNMGLLNDLYQPSNLNFIEYKFMGFSNILIELGQAHIKVT